MYKDLLPWKEVWENESAERKALDKNTLCHFGIKAIDDAMPYIHKNELIVIGSDSGVGKSTLSVTIALHNAMKKKRVALFYLEGGDMEAMARIKFKLITQELNKNEMFKSYISYSEWRCGAGTDKLKDIEAIIYKTLIDKIEDNLWIYPITTGFTINDFIASLAGFHSLEGMFATESKIDLDLIIVDHLQYFELTGGQSEIEQTTNILRELKQLADRYKIPVVLVSHLRKTYRDRGLPDQEDFYGSSNIPKISTVSIVLSGDKSKQDFSDGLFPTFIRFVKSRIGLRSSYVIRVNFDSTTLKYEDKYGLFYVKDSNQPSKDPIPFHKLPYWAKGNVTYDTIRKTDNSEEDD